MAQAERTLEGKTISIESGTLAKQADGAVCVRVEDTIVLATVVPAPPREGMDYFPLLVDYEEKMYAAGKIPGLRYLRREARPSEAAILAARRIDRPLRPLFPKGMRNEVQVIITVLSADLQNPPDVLGILGASAALCVSSIPFNGPVGAARVARVDGQLILNPTHQQVDQADLDLAIVGARDGLLSFEATADAVPEEDLLEAGRFAWPHIQSLIDMQEELVRAIGKPKFAFESVQPKPDILAAAEPFAGQVNEALQHPDKFAREGAMQELEDEIVNQLIADFPDRRDELKAAVDALAQREFRRLVLDEGRRPDGRGAREIRAMAMDVGLLPRAHGSGLFQRGQTQVLSTTTLGGIGEEQLIEGLGIIESKRFLHHYNFPPFSVGEVRPLRGPSRRDIGHGSLAERALISVVPTEEEFPYTIRVVSDVLESNGSSSKIGRAHV